MSLVVNPPEFQFIGLFYNPEWWAGTSASGSLTEEEANVLYLRKTVPDTASALETFNAGLKSSSYDTITAGATQNMFSTQTANTNLFPNMGAGQTLKLGNQTTAQSVHVSQIDCNGSTINNAAAPANGALSIGNLQTGAAGILNLGTNAARTGPINIGGVGSTGKITLNRPLSVGYSIVPASGDIGSRELLVSGTFTSGGVGVSTNVFTLTAQPIGTFIYEFRFNFSTICLFTSSFSLVSATHNAGFSITIINTTTDNNYFKNIQVVANTPSVVDWYVVASSSVASTALTSCGVVRTRLG